MEVKGNVGWLTNRKDGYMPMDEVVFTREKVKRTALELVEQLEKADREYDPSEAVNMEDVISAAGLLALRAQADEYVKALKAHAENTDPSLVNKYE
jgi:hypothetical protein